MSKTIAEKLNNLAKLNPQARFYVAICDGGYFAYWNRGTALDQYRDKHLDKYFTDNQVMRKISKKTYYALCCEWEV